jgi:hypothetical protein
MNEEPSRYADDDSRPAVVRDALRAMRSEGPSDDSRRAALAAFGLDPRALPTLPPSPPAPLALPATPRSLPLFLRWALAGLALGLVTLALLRLLGP